MDPSGFPLGELWPAMGYRSCEPDRSVRDIALQMVRELLPKAVLRCAYRRVEASRTAPGDILLDGRPFHTGGIIGSYLDGMTHALVFVATAGAEFEGAVDELHRQGDIVADFVADSIGSVLAEAAVARLEKEVGLSDGISLPYSPGYCGWDVCEQQSFFSLFPPRPCGVTLSESSLMKPEKSVSGFFALGEKLTRQPYHCQICRNTKCFKRKDASQSQ